MELPDDILSIIRDYSKPLTKPDWRTIGQFTKHILYHDLYDVLYYGYGSVKLHPLYKRVFNHLCKSQWGELYIYIRVWGIREASGHFNIPVSELYKMPGMVYAEEYYVREHYFYDSF